MPDIDPSWQKVLSVIRVTRSGVRDGIAYSTLSYCICSLPFTSTRIAKVIRQHWHIENRLHWVKDVLFNEDESKQRAGKTPINLSVIRSWVLSIFIFRNNGFESIKVAIDYFVYNLPAMLSLLT